MLRTKTVRTEEALDALVAEYLTKTHFVYDVESIGEHRGTPALADVRWISLACDSRVDVIPLGHPHGNLLRPAFSVKVPYWDREAPLTQTGKPRKKWRQVRRRAVFGPAPEQLDRQLVFDRLRPLMMNDSIIKIGHGLKYDLMAVAKYLDNKVPAPPYADTLGMAKLLLDEYDAKSLKALTERFYQTVYPDKNIGKNIALHGFDDVARYSALDASLDFLLYEDLEPKIDELGMREVFDLEMDVLHAVARGGLTGVAIDVEPLMKLGEDVTEAMREKKKIVWEAAKAKINLEADADIAELVYVKRKHRPTSFTSKTNKPSVNKAALASIAKKDPVVQAVLDYRYHAKMHSTYIGTQDEDGKYLTGLLSQVHEGMLYTDLDQWGAATGRFSSRRPNLQNIPARDERGELIRATFIAPPGTALVLADYSQIEYRVLAYLSREVALLEAFDQGWDPHAATAALLYGIAIEDVTPEQRDVGKTFNFAQIYGAGLEKLAATAKTDIETVRQMREQYERSLPRVISWKEDVIREARRQRPPSVRTILGRRRILRGLNYSDRDLRAYAERQAVNTVVQGSAADLIKMAMVNVNRNLPEDWHMVLQVHDELILIVPEEDADQATKSLQVWMEEINPMDVPVVAEAHWGYSWKEAKAA